MSKDWLMIDRIVILWFILTEFPASHIERLITNSWCCSIMLKRYLIVILHKSMFVQVFMNRKLIYVLNGNDYIHIHIYVICIHNISGMHVQCKFMTYLIRKHYTYLVFATIIKVSLSMINTNFPENLKDFSEKSQLFF